MKRFLLIGFLLLTTSFSFSQNQGIGTLIEPSVKSPIEDFYGEKLNIAIHKIEGLKKEHEPTDHFLFQHNGDFEQSISGEVIKSKWSYNEDENSISIFLQSTVVYTIKEIQVKKLVLVNEKELLRLYIPEKQSETPVDLMSVKDVSNEVQPKMIVSPLKLFYDKELYFVKDIDGKHKISHDDSDYIFLFSNGIYKELSLNIESRGKWGFNSKMNILLVPVLGIKPFKVTIIDDNTFKIKNKERRIILSLNPLIKT